MTRVLLVDDESVTRRGLLRGIPWEDLGISEVIEARDGAEALSLVNQYAPDIVVTDVRMPQMNGIELAAELRKRTRRVQIIFISGYSDKDYLKAAIRLGVIGYVEKPIELSEIIAALRQAAEQARALDAPPARDFLPLVRQDMIGRLVKPGADVWGLSRGLALVGVRLDLEAMYFVMIVQINGGFDLVKDYLARLEKALPAAVLLEKDDRIVVLFQAADEASAHSEYARALALIQGQEDAHLAFAAAGLPVRGLAQLYASYQQAVLALQRLFFLGYGHATRYRPDERALALPSKGEETFLRLLAEERYEELEPCVRRLCLDLLDRPQMLVNHVQRLFLRLTTALVREGEQRRVPLGELSGADEEQLWNAISHCATIGQLETLTLHMVRALTEELNDARSVNRKVARALRLIDEQYGNPELSVQLLADQVHLTQPYLSMLFKKTVGRAISEYLLALRMEKSKQLLIEGDVRLGEIANLVGYNDANAYAKAFKRMTGLSPAKFRARYAR